MPCEKCKHWKPVPASEDEAPSYYLDDWMQAGLGECTKILAGLEYRDYIKDGPKLIELDAVIDYDVASLRTRSTFHCSLFEEKGNG